MGQFCQPNTTPDGQKTAWGTVAPEDLFGPEGWCMAEKPKVQCECFLDGALEPPRCDVPLSIASDSLLPQQASYQHAISNQEP
jgi:hypothetical protein